MAKFTSRFPRLRIPFNPTVGLSRVKWNILGTSSSTKNGGLADSETLNIPYSPCLLVNLWARAPVAICLSTGSWQIFFFLVSMCRPIASVANYVKYSYIFIYCFSIFIIYVFVCFFCLTICGT